MIRLEPTVRLSGHEGPAVRGTRGGARSLPPGSATLLLVLKDSYICPSAFMPANYLWLQVVFVVLLVWSLADLCLLSLSIALLSVVGVVWGFRTFVILHTSHEVLGIEERPKQVPRLAPRWEARLEQVYVGMYTGDIRNPTQGPIPNTEAHL